MKGMKDKIRVEDKLTVLHEGDEGQNQGWAEANCPS
jgi:hypothetical protein